MKTTPKNNPNGANQYQADPRQSLFIKNYLDPKSETFSNAYQSALKAGYEDEYAKVIVSKDLDWLSESINDEEMVRKAEKNLRNLMDSEDEKIKGDISKFVAGRLGKKKWSDRIEHTGAEGGDIKVNIVNYGNSDSK